MAKRRRKRHGRKHTVRRRRRRSVAAAPRRRRRRRSRRSHAPRRRRRRRATGTVAIPRRRRRRASGTLLMHASAAKTLRANPGRRRRRRRSRARGRSRAHRRYRRGFRRNPGGFLVDLLKKALPAAAGFLGNKLVVTKIGPMLPGVSALGTFQNPVLSILGLVGWNWATKRVGFLAKHKAELLTGASIQAFLSVLDAFAPASVKGMLGMGDYVAVGDYFSMSGAPPLNDQITMSDYIAVGGDGVEEELGLEEELGVEEELGSDVGGVMPGQALLAPVPRQAFMQPVPARSFTRGVPPAGTAYDNPNGLYTGIFSGRFGT